MSCSLVCYRTPARNIPHGYTTNLLRAHVLDVQVTKDYVPVIYHDFLVAESGTDIGMHEVTFEQVNIALLQPWALVSLLSFPS